MDSFKDLSAISFTDYGRLNLAFNQAFNIMPVSHRVSNIALLDS